MTDGGRRELALGERCCATRNCPTVAGKHTFDYGIARMDGPGWQSWQPGSGSPATAPPIPPIPPSHNPGPPVLPDSSKESSPPPRVSKRVHHQKVPSFVPSHEANQANHNTRLTRSLLPSTARVFQQGSVVWLRLLARLSPTQPASQSTASPRNRQRPKRIPNFISGPE